MSTEQSRILHRLSDLGEIIVLEDGEVEQTPVGVYAQKFMQILNADLPLSQAEYVNFKIGQYVTEEDLHKVRFKDHKQYRGNITFNRYGLDTSFEHEEFKAAYFKLTMLEQLSQNDDDFNIFLKNMSSLLPARIIQGVSEEDKTLVSMRTEYKNEKLSQAVMVAEESFFGLNLPSFNDSLSSQDRAWLFYMLLNFSEGDNQIDKNSNLTNFLVRASDLGSYDYQRETLKSIYENMDITSRLVSGIARRADFKDADDYAAWEITDNSSYYSDEFAIIGQWVNKHAQDIKALADDYVMEQQAQSEKAKRQEANNNPSLLQRAIRLTKRS